MGGDVAGLDVVPLAEEADQGLGRRDLPRRGGLPVQVADQADPDPVFVDVVAAGIPAVHALLLVIPALRDLDLAVAATLPVADHEVIAAAVITQDLAVLAIDLIDIAAGRGAMVEHDVPPGPISLVGVEELVGRRFAEERPESIAPAGAANRRGGRRAKSLTRRRIVVARRGGRAGVRRDEGRCRSRGGGLGRGCGPAT